ncbi:MAG: heme-binding protein [Rhodobacteraceae bacterium]|nr:heme-binding protein [Paracoccaceae bacterium]
MITTKQEVSPEAGLQLVTFALDHAKTQGWDIAVSVCDPAGNQVAFLRSENVISPAADFACDKAYTAATLRKSTSDFFERMSGTPSLALGLSNRPRLMVWTGGLPLFHEGVCIGGIGVSGAQDFEDVECARVAIEKVGLAESG